MEQTIYKPHSGNDFLADVMLSCPFCGGEPELTFIGNDYSKSRKVEIKCKECRVKMVKAGIRSGSEQLAKWSIEAWNNRFGGQSKQLLKTQGDWLMANTSVEVEKIVDFVEHFKQ